MGVVKVKIDSIEGEPLKDSYQGNDGQVDFWVTPIKGRVDGGMVEEFGIKVFKEAMAGKLAIGQDTVIPFNGNGGRWAGTGNRCKGDPLAIGSGAHHAHFHIAGDAA